MTFRVWTDLSAVGVALGLSLVWQIESQAVPWFAVVEAESMALTGDWKVIKGQEGYFPAAPNCWSADRLRAGADAAKATATAEVDIPADGRYAVWVRYESPSGFDVHFGLAIRQGNATAPAYEQIFGDRSDEKYFNGTWRVQGPWSYHNTDYVYQRGLADLKKGRAVLTLAKGPSHDYTAARIVDLIYLTDDLDMEPGRELNAWLERGEVATFYQPRVMMDCTRPVYFRVALAADAPATNRVVLAYRHGAGWRGPQRDLAFTTNGALVERYAVENRQLETQVARNKAEFPANEQLPAGFESGWARYDLCTFNSATITVKSGARVRLWVSHHADGRNAEIFDIGTNAQPVVLVATGNSRLEDELFRGKPAGTAEAFARHFAEQLRAYQVPGKRPFAFANLVNPPESFGAERWPFLEAAGGSGIYFSVPPDLYLPENAARWGVNRAMAYRALQNMTLKFEYYEGDYPKMRQALEGVRTALETNGVGDIPQTFKMIEESGPPPLSKMGASAPIRDRFRAYVQSVGLKPADLLDRKTLAFAVAAGKIAEADLWPLVTLCAGTP